MFKQGRQLVPTFTAFAVNNVLEYQFEQLVDVGFTADMEQVLDDIASGEIQAVPYLQRFYRGQNGLETKVEKGLDKIDARDVSTIEHPKWGDYVVRVGKYGPYVEGTLESERVTASLPDEVAPADLTEEDIHGYLKEGNAEDRVLGIHPDAEQPVLLKKGPYGPYVQLGDDEQKGRPKRMSLPKGVEPTQVTFQLALDLLSLPRPLGEHPETGEPILANIGRYGPYVQHQRTFASLGKEDDIFEVDLDRALELIAKKEKKSQALRVLGKHPKTGDPVEVFEGRYGPYVKHQKTNASLPKNLAVDAVTMEQAVEMLDAKAGSSKGGRTSSKKKTTAKASGTKTTSKKASSTKATKASTTKAKSQKTSAKGTSAKGGAKSKAASKPGGSKATKK